MQKTHFVRCKEAWGAMGAASMTDGGEAVDVLFTMDAGQGEVKKFITAELRKINGGYDAKSKDFIPMTTHVVLRKSYNIGSNQGWGWAC